MIKKILLVLLLVMGLSLETQAADLSFKWKANTDAVTGYKIHYGTKPGVYDKFVDVGLPAVIDGYVTGMVKDIPENVMYYYAATAYNHDKESLYSNEVAYTAEWSVPVSVNGFEIVITVKPKE